MGAREGRAESCVRFPRALGEALPLRRGTYDVRGSGFGGDRGGRWLESHLEACRVKRAPASVWRGGIHSDLAGGSFLTFLPRVAVVRLQAAGWVMS
jgi:hypothetical protein